MGLLGLAARAGKVASGEYQTEKSIKAGRARLVLLAQNASDGTKKKFTDSCTFYQVPWICLEATKDELGQAIGRQERACAAIEESGFAEAFRQKLEHD